MNEKYIILDPKTNKNINIKQYAEIENVENYINYSLNEAHKLND
jgi:hypothetical protein